MLQEKVDAFLEMMQAERGSSHNTILSYRHDLTDFLKYLDETHQNILTLDNVHLRGYLTYLKSRKISPRTQGRHLSAIREFYRFAYSEDWVKENPCDYLEMPKIPKSLPKYLTEDEVLELIDYARSENKRLYTLLEVVYASGLRVSELVGLPFNAFNPDESHLFVIGKGSKERIVPLNEHATKALAEWVIYRERMLKRPSKWLFPSSLSKSGHLTRGAFFKELKKLAGEIGLNPDRKLFEDNAQYVRTALVAYNAIFDDLGDLSKPEYLIKIVEDAINNRGEATMAEKQDIEWKESWRDEYLKWICGFANAKGGKIYIGTDDNGNVVGLEDSKKLMEDIPNKINNYLGIIVDVNLLEEDGKEYIEIDVPPVSYPVSYRGEYHYRSGSTKQGILRHGGEVLKRLLKPAGKSGQKIRNMRLSLGISQ